MIGSTLVLCNVKPTTCLPTLNKNIITQVRQYAEYLASYSPTQPVLFSVFVQKGMSTDTDSADSPSSAMEQTEFLELATDSASLINIQSLNSIFVKSGFDRPDFIIKPTREKVHVTTCCLSPLASSVHSIWLTFNFISSLTTTQIMIF